MLTQKPKEWRDGQTIFNFLEWLAMNKDVPYNQAGRMCDPFHIQDEDMEKYWEEFMENK
jgi:hypothetical protein